MRILHIILSTHFAGSEAHCCWLAAQQARAGHDVAVLVRDQDHPYVARIRREASPASILLLPSWMSGIFERIGCWNTARRFMPHVIHAHLGRAARRAIRPHSRVPLVATLHIDWRRHYLRCDGVICIASWQKADIPASYGGRVEVIWNSAPPVPPSTPDVARRDTDRVEFLSVGRLIANKGMDVLVAAFRKAFPTGDEAVTLTIAGDGPERDRLAGLAAGDGRIRMLGYVEDVRPLYRAAHVYVSSARVEPFGLTILEAMQAGCQLICSRTEGPSEFLAQHDPKWVDIDDSDALADALRHAAVPPVPSKTWDMRAFAPAAAADKIEAFYKACIADLAQR